MVAAATEVHPAAVHLLKRSHLLLHQCPIGDMTIVLLQSSDSVCTACTHFDCSKATTIASGKAAERRLNEWGVQFRTHSLEAGNLALPAYEAVPTDAVQMLPLFHHHLRTQQHTRPPARWICIGLTSSSVVCIHVHDSDGKASESNILHERPLLQPANM